LKDGQLEFPQYLIERIKFEHDRQIQKWGIQDHASPEWMLILNEEVGELNKAVLENWFSDYNKFTPEQLELSLANVIKEAISVATLALKIAEMFEKEGD